MKSKTQKIRDVAIGAVAAAFFAPIAASAEDTTKLKFADWLPTSHQTPIQGANVFIDKARELSGGSVDITYYPAEQLGKASDMLRLTQTGVADIASIAPAYMTEKLPLSGVSELPSIYENACDGSFALMKMTEPGGLLYENEIKSNGFRVLFVGAYGAYRALTASTPIEAAADFEGLKIRTAGGAMDMTAQAVGATSVRIPGPDVMPSLTRGTLDAVFFPLQSVRPFGAEEVLNYLTPNLGVGSFTVFYGMSERKWQSLPEEARNVLAEAGRFATEHHCSYLERAEQALVTSLADEDGMELVPLPDDEVADLLVKFKGVQQDWATALDKRGLPGSETLNVFRETLADVAK